MTRLERRRLKHARENAVKAISEGADPSEITRKMIILLAKARETRRSWFIEEIFRDIPLSNLKAFDLTRLYGIVYSKKDASAALAILKCHGEDIDKNVSKKLCDVICKCRTAKIVADTISAYVDGIVSLEKSSYTSLNKRFMQMTTPLPTPCYA